MILRPKLEIIKYINIFINNANKLWLENASVFNSHEMYLLNKRKSNFYFIKYYI